MERKFKNTPVEEFVLDQYTRGFAQCIDNNWNYAIYAQNPDIDIYQQEYNAGYVQGKVQGLKAIKAARNNTYNNTILDQTSGYPGNSNIIPDGLTEVFRRHLTDNYNYLYKWVGERQDDEKARNITRLMFRQLGIFDGAVDNTPRKDVKLADLDLESMTAENASLHLFDEPLTFLDVYFINAQMDVMDAAAEDMKPLLAEVSKIDNAALFEGPIQPSGVGLFHRKALENGFQDDYHPSRCSGFVRKLENGEIIWAHTSWCCVYSQTCAVTYVIGDDFLTQNCYCQGQFGSNTDFGFNGHGIGFNETTETYNVTVPKTLGVWITWRAAAAEHFAKSIDEFYDYCMIDNTGTYLNGYMVVDAYKGLFGLVDMSYKRMALFKSDGTELTVKESTDYVPDQILDWDHHMITPTHLLGCNIPIYRRIWHDCATIDGAPKRRYQLFRNIGNVYTLDDARQLITFNSDKEPISIAGRWDLGYGTSEMIAHRPHASIDAKVFGTEEIKAVLASLSKKPSKDGKATSFWMKYGTPYISGQPFIWSRSLWAKYKQPEEVDFVPDVVDGRWNLVKMFME